MGLRLSFTERHFPGSATIYPVQEIRGERLARPEELAIKADALKTCPVRPGTVWDRQRV
jgi:hypothetical protein